MGDPVDASVIAGKARSTVLAEMSVPIIADDVRSRGLARFNYLVVENDVPTPGWTISTGAETLPFLMLGVSGIVMQPFGEPRFGSPELIEDLFARVEDDLVLSIGVDDIWLPEFTIHQPISPGDVFRIRADLFRHVFAMREGRILVESWQSFANTGDDMRLGMSFSQSETSAFAEWSSLQVNAARSAYPKNRELQLHRVDEE